MSSSDIHAAVSHGASEACPCRGGPVRSLPGGCVPGFVRADKSGTAPGLSVLRTAVLRTAALQTAALQTASRRRRCCGMDGGSGLWLRAGLPRSCGAGHPGCGAGTEFVAPGSGTPGIRGAVHLWPGELWRRNGRLGKTREDLEALGQTASRPNESPDGIGSVTGFPAGTLALPGLALPGNVLLRGERPSGLLPPSLGANAPRDERPSGHPTGVPSSSCGFS